MTSNKPLRITTSVISYTIQNIPTNYRKCETNKQNKKKIINEIQVNLIPKISVSMSESKFRLVRSC